MRTPRRTAAVLGIATVLVCVAAVAIWHFERVLRKTERGLGAREDLTVSERDFVAEPNPGFEAVSTPAIFRSAAVFENRIYLSGPSGLFAYSQDGLLQHIFRSGIDLPAAPLGRLATATLADSRGPELLMATGGAGVLAFDGHRFRQILPAAPECRNITALLPLPSGRLLLGTAKWGLLIFDGKSLQRFHATTNNLYITALAGNESELWIGTLDRGVVHWRGGQAQMISTPEGLPDVRVESIDVESNAAYVGTPAGVAEVRGGKVNRVLARGSNVQSLLAEPDELFVGQFEGGILKVGTGAEDGPSPLRRRVIAVNRDRGADLGNGRDGDAPVEQLLRIGDARYAVAGNQLLRLEPGGAWRGVLQSVDALLTDGNISALSVAADGRVWVGYFDRGLDILPAAGGRPLHVENEHVFCVNRIVENPRQGTVAVATANGLVLFDRDGRQKQILTRESGLIATHVTDVAIYGDGMVAGTPAGITFLDSSGPHSMYAFQGLVNNHVYALGARDNALMVGTLGGISLVSGGEVRRNLNTGNSGMKANWTTALAPAGFDWMAGTYGAGVVRIAPDGTVSLTDASTQGTVVNPGAMASDGHVVLAGTLGGGLLVGDENGIRWKTITAGLPSRNVTALAIHNGIVYVGTDNGLVKIAENKL